MPLNKHLQSTIIIIWSNSLLPKAYSLFFTCYYFNCCLATWCSLCNKAVPIWQGYDVVAMASPERYVVGLEISDIAIKKAEEVTTVCKFQVSTYRDVEMYISQLFLFLWMHRHYHDNQMWWSGSLYYFTESFELLFISKFSLYSCLSN